jgi:hypothetical protein
MPSVNRRMVPGMILVACMTSAAGAARDACRASSLAPFDAHTASAAGDRSTALAKCSNLPDAAARKPCARQAASDE